MKKNLVAGKFTVAIDCTIDFLRSPDMQEFLASFEQEIQDGKLNVVFFRSAQKYDMLGLDNYFGGYTITINNSTSYKAFNDRISDKEDQVPGLAHQGLTHLVKYGSEDQDAYRDALMKNTRYLYDKLIAAGLGDTTSRLYIAPSDDKNMVFLDIIAGDSFRSGLKNIFLKWLRYHNLAVSERPSFGFPMSNFLEIQPKLRLNPGLESKAVLDCYVFFFKKMHHLLTTDYVRFYHLGNGEYKKDEFNPWKHIKDEQPKPEEQPKPDDQPEYYDYFMGSQPGAGDMASYCGYYALSNYIGKPIALQTYQQQMNRQFRALGIAEHEIPAFIKNAGTAAEGIFVQVYHFTEDRFMGSRSLPDAAIINKRFMAAIPGHILTYKKDGAGTWWELDSLANAARPIGNRTALTRRLIDNRTLNIYYSDASNRLLDFFTSWNKYYNKGKDLLSNLKPSKNKKNDNEPPKDPLPTPPQIFFLRQPKSGKLAGYCGYYALCHYMNEELNLNEIENLAIEYRQRDTGESRSDIRASMLRDGLSVNYVAMETYHLSGDKDPTKALHSDRFMAATYKNTGHWLTYIRHTDGYWWEYDSWQDEPDFAGNDEAVRIRLRNDGMSSVYWRN